VKLLHGRWRARVSLLAAGVLDGSEEAAVRAHLIACPDCRRDHDEARRVLAWVERDPVRSAEPPVPVAFLEARVRARLDQAAPPARPVRWAAWGAGLAAAALAVAIVPVVLQRVGPSTTATATTTEVLVPADVMARMERRLARDSAARYLDEAQDLLVTVSAHPPDCEEEHGRVDVGEEARRSRELLERRALMVELGGDEVASAQPLLDDVEGLLREVAALPACVRADALEAIHRQMERRHVLMKIDLLTRELRG
jgi:predicted anti-sigma-YlaC factor YlaD